MIVSPSDSPFLHVFRIWLMKYVVEVHNKKSFQNGLVKTDSKRMSLFKWLYPGKLQYGWAPLRQNFIFKKTKLKIVFWIAEISFRNINFILGEFCRTWTCMLKTKIVHYDMTILSLLPLNFRHPATL